MTFIFKELGRSKHFYQINGHTKLALFSLLGNIRTRSPIIDFAFNIPDLSKLLMKSKDKLTNLSFF